MRILSFLLVASLTGSSLNADTGTTEPKKETICVADTPQQALDLLIREMNGMFETT